ncbi:hypothetical protein [Streptomyces rubiginosohelvolus]|uniref:hypothetical protein n=1 Tax=Streptomyces rubiginosohelvolus TaxID=67362 RepID=UPI0035E273C4
MITEPNRRALAGEAATLAAALHAYAKRHPGGRGGAVLEIRDQDNMRVFAASVDQEEMDALAALFGDMPDDTARALTARQRTWAREQQDELAGNAWDQVQTVIDLIDPDKEQR